MISDVTMPGMDGAALTHLVLEQHPGLPVILTSGYVAASEEFNVANVAFLVKPFGQDELLDAVTRIIAAIA
jgi:FixJ family two-component response regulator